jgi:hypothetical protein
MKNPAFNPMQPENFCFRDGVSLSAGGFARFGASTSLAGDCSALDEIEAAQVGLLHDALAIGHAPSIAAALGLIARMRGMGRGYPLVNPAFNPKHPANCHLYVVNSTFVRLANR